MNYKRSGDIYFHPIKRLPTNLKEINHNGKFIFAVGEASNHNHTIVIDRPADLKILQDKEENYYYDLRDEAKLMHLEGTSTKTAEHEVITIKPGIYIQVPEREVDIFTQAVRRVID